MGKSLVVKGVNFAANAIGSVVVDEPVMGDIDTSNANWKIGWVLSANASYGGVGAVYDNSANATAKIARSATLNKIPVDTSHRALRFYVKDNVQIQICFYNAEEGTNTVTPFDSGYYGDASGMVDFEIKGAFMRFCVRYSDNAALPDALGMLVDKIDYID